MDIQKALQKLILPGAIVLFGIAIFFAQAKLWSWSRIKPATGLSLLRICHCGWAGPCGGGTCQEKGRLRGCTLKGTFHAAGVRGWCCGKGPGSADTVC